MLKRNKSKSMTHNVPSQIVFQVGELVMKKNFRRKKMKGGKLQDRFDGPHRVVKKFPHGIYELISTLIRATGGHLKMYHSNMLQGITSFDDKQASSKVISVDPSTSGVKPDDTSICSGIECDDPPTPSDAEHDGLLTLSDIGCDDTLTTSDAKHDGLLKPSDIGCDDTLITSDVEHDGLTAPSDVGCDGTQNISHAKPDDQPTTSDIEHKDLLPLKDAESPVLLFCSCKTRATKRCLCKLNHSCCGHYCHPGKSCCNIEICFGKDPSSVKFVQSTMRQHLIEGLEQGNILPFPSAVRRQRSQVVRQEVF